VLYDSAPKKTSESFFPTPSPNVILSAAFTILNTFVALLKVRKQDWRDMNRDSIVRHTAILIGALFVASAIIYLVIRLIAFAL